MGPKYVSNRPYSNITGMNLPSTIILIYYRPSKQLNVSVPYRKWYDLSQSTLKIWYWITFVFYGTTAAHLHTGKSWQVTQPLVYNDKLIFIRIRNVIEDLISVLILQMLESYWLHHILAWNSISMRQQWMTLCAKRKAFYFLVKCFTGEPTLTFGKTGIKWKVIDFSFIFIFSLPLSQTACSWNKRSSTILSKLRISKTLFFHWKFVKTDIHLQRKFAVYWKNADAKHDLHKTKYWLE